MTGICDEIRPQAGLLPLTIYLAAPRGFCAGVDRAIQIVELALAKYGAPVYVRHEIVHNRYVVESLEAKGAVFVEELDEIPDTDAPVVFSAHGVPKSVPEAAATAQAVLSRRHLPAGLQGASRGRAAPSAAGREILLIGHAGHPEVIGTMGQLPAGRGAPDRDHRRRRASSRRTRRRSPTSPRPRCRSTTPGHRRGAEGALPATSGPHKEDICYATTNRQDAVKAIAGRCERMLVVGAPNCSNSLRLVEVAKRAGCPCARSGAARGRDRLGDLTASAGSASPPAPRRRRCWSRR